MRIALTGTPGSGKSSLAHLLRAEGRSVYTVEELAAASGALGPPDPEDDARVVDLARLKSALPREESFWLVGHLAHRLPVDLSIVLRTHPETLRARLEARGWSPDKVQENVEAEALGVIAMEALEGGEAFEIDTTDRSPEAVRERVDLILRGEGTPYRVGKIDWSEVILAWF